MESRYACSDTTRYRPGDAQGHGSCWVFTGALSAAGYGVVGAGGRGAGNAFPEYTYQGKRQRKCRTCIRERAKDIDTYLIEETTHD